jgi:hypothetical protein
VELNNQAKHSVSNESDRCFRVHLIFDYMDPPDTDSSPDPDPASDLPVPPSSSSSSSSSSSCALLAQPRPQRVRLEPGDQLSQTRRTIDIVREVSSIRRYVSLIDRMETHCTLRLRWFAPAAFCRRFSFSECRNAALPRCMSTSASIRSCSRANAG